MKLSFSGALGRSGELDFTKPVHVRGRSGAGKSLLIDIFLFAIGNLERSGGSCRPLGTDGEPFIATLSDGDVTVQRTQTGNTWKAALLTITGPRRIASQADTFKTLAPVLGCDNLRVAAFLANPFEWARFASSDGGGEDLRNFLFEHIASPGRDIYEGLLLPGEPRDDKAAFKMRADATKQMNVASGVLLAADQALKDHGVRPSEPDPDDVAEAEAVVAGSAAASSAYALYSSALDAHAAWKRRKADHDLRHAQWRTSEPPTPGAEPPLDDQQEARDFKARRDRLVNEMGPASSRRADATHRTVRLEQSIASTQREMAPGEAPECAARFAACQHSIDRANRVAYFEGVLERDHLALAEAKAQFTEADAALAAIHTEIANVDTALNAITSTAERKRRDHLAWQDRKAKFDRWDATEPKFAEPEPQIPQPVDPPPDVTFYSDALRQYAAAARDVGEWDKRYLLLTEKCTAAKANFDSTVKSVARAEFVLTTLRDRPGQVLKEFLDALDLGPVSLVPVERGIRVLYDGVDRENLSDGQIVATSLWLRTAVAKHLGLTKVPIFVDNIQDCVGLPLPDCSPFRMVYLHTEDCDLTAGAK
jgi:hypothetical protein